MIVRNRPPNAPMQCVGRTPAAPARWTSTRHIAGGRQGTELWATQKFTFQGAGTRRHPAKVHRGSAEVRIYFRGGTNALIGDGDGGIGSIQATNNTIGICNLEFDVS